MTAWWRHALRALVVGAALAVTLAGLSAVRLADWPTYVVFLLISVVLFLPYVEVLPRIKLPIPEMAASIGFLYIAGLPVIVLRNLAPALARLLAWALPEQWKARLPQLRAGAGITRRELLGGGWGAASPISGVATEWAASTLGIGVRWVIACQLASPRELTAHPEAIALAELGGYACWGLLAILPIYPNRPLLPFSARGLRTALADIGFIIALALTPFVFLIAYGFQTAGLSGAAAWSLSTLGLHFMLQRLNERRLQVEAQNRRLEALNRELEHRERLSAIGKMSSVVSHQILQQLGVIGIYADLIRNSGGETDPPGALADARRNAAAIEAALQDVNRVLTDLLVFSRDLRLNLYDHPLQLVIEEALDDCRAEASARDVTVRAEGILDITLTVDKLKIKQALVNIIRNAIEVSPPASAVVVRSALGGGNVEVTVSDRGPGVAEADREAIFAPFFTTKEQGTGLGLAIARQFAEAHGGRAWAEANRDGHGSTFTIRLPLRPPQPGP
ncbi:MAG: HAMP domain-containing histidine kinase [Deltaproteobacteria bacterium]|nr:HAMP domain-containing histidine kinase [Deltaproteobacteria bacterium]